jgi:hypothetical protein
VVARAIAGGAPRHKDDVRQAEAGVVVIGLDSGSGPALCVGLACGCGCRPSVPTGDPSGDRHKRGPGTAGKEAQSRLRPSGLTLPLGQAAQ